MNQPSDSPTPRQHFPHLRAATAGTSRREQAAVGADYLTALAKQSLGSTGITRRKPVPAWLARRRTRRLPGASPVLPLLCGLTAATTDHIIGAILGLTMVLSTATLWVLLRRATTILATGALLPSAIIAWRWREPDDPRQ